jgi:hypothetical protein
MPHPAITQDAEHTCCRLALAISPSLALLRARSCDRYWAGGGAGRRASTVEIQDGPILFPRGDEADDFCCMRDIQG